MAEADKIEESPYILAEDVRDELFEQELELNDICPDNERRKLIGRTIVIICGFREHHLMDPERCKIVRSCKSDLVLACAFKSSGVLDDNDIVNMLVDFVEIYVKKIIKRMS